MIRPYIIAFTIVSSLILSGCLKDEWEGFVYPNKNNLSEHINIGSYDSLEECRTSAINALNRISSVHDGDYECGLNCKSKNGLEGIKICEETSR